MVQQICLKQNIKSKSYLSSEFHLFHDSCLLQSTNCLTIGLTATAFDPIKSRRKICSEQGRKFLRWPHQHPSITNQFSLLRRSISRHIYDGIMDTYGERCKAPYRQLDLFAHPAVATSMAFGVGAKAARRKIRRKKPPICVPKAIYAVTVCTYMPKRRRRSRASVRQTRRVRYMSVMLITTSFYS